MKLIERIEHIEDPEERAQLNRFYEKVGLG